MALSKNIEIFKLISNINIRQVGELAAFNWYDSVDKNMYMERYKLPVPGSIRKRVWSKLIALGYFSAEEESQSGTDLLLGQMEDEPRARDYFGSN